MVIVATVRALKYHGGQAKEAIKEENLEALNKGIRNLNRHIDNIKNKFGLNVVVAINKFYTDTENELKLLEEKLKDRGILVSLVESYSYGSKGAQDLAKKVIELSNDKSNFNYIYNENDDVRTKLEKVATSIYGAEGVKFSEEAEKQLEKINDSKFPVCIAKTQYSFSDDDKNLECEEPFYIHVNELNLKAGAEFIVAITGKIMTMPGLPKVPSAEKINIDDNENIIGIF